VQILLVDVGEKVEAIRGSQYFMALDEHVLSQLAKGTTLRSYERGEAVFWEGDACAGLHMVRKGSVKLFKVSPQGRELIVNTYAEETTFNEVPVFDHGANPVNVAALENSEIWVIDADVIRQTMKEHPEMFQAVITSLSQNLRMLVSKVEELSFYQVTNRLARLISQIPEEQLSGQSPNRLTQDQMAARLGTVREVVARSLRELQRSGAIRVQRRQIKIVDERVLKEWAQTPFE
jgi:CRP/FNR family transcriptional regulator